MSGLTSTETMEQTERYQMSGDLNKSPQLDCLKGITDSMAIMAEASGSSVQVEEMAEEEHKELVFLKQAIATAKYTYLV